MALQDSVGELKGTVRSLSGNVETQEKNFRTDFKWTWTGLAAATVLLMGAFIFGYFKLDERINTMSTALTRIETKVDGLRPSPPLPSVLPGPR
jgi:hypothetical protein